MRLLNNIFFFCTFFPLSLYCLAQREKIDSLQKILPLLRDTARVDCLNQLSGGYIETDKKDFAQHYNSMAYLEANKLNYIHGIAVSFCRKSQLVRHFFNDFPEAEKLGKESLRWYEQTGNKDGINDLYYWLCTVAYAQSKFEEAIGYSEKRYMSAKQHGNELEMMNALGYTGGIYMRIGDYEKSFLTLQQQYDYALKTKNKINIASCLWEMALLYGIVEDYSNALLYFRRMWQMDDNDISRSRIANDYDIWVKMEFAEVFSHLHQFDSAWHYYHLFKPGTDKNVYMRVYWISTGECYLLQKDYKHALQNFQLGLAEHKKLNDKNEIIRTLLDIGKTYLALNNNLEAFNYGQQGLILALQTKAKPSIRDGYQILSTIYDRLHQRDSADFYFRKYIIMRDSVLNDQVKGKLVAYNFEQRIALMNKEKLIGQQQLKIKQQQLQQQSFQKKILVVSIIALLVVAGIVVRIIVLKRRNEKQHLQHEIEVERLESEKTKAGLQKQAAELEMQALRAQMNPHFIFNSLNSINMFILENNKLRASEYLSKFSRLVRLILQNSQEAFIPLEREIEALQLYLELESLRFDKKFDYKIVVDHEVETTVLRVPPLIVQPYVENAIWHGLMHKKERGHLAVNLYTAQNNLFCKIIDDGIGRKKAEELKNKIGSTHKSIGLRITADRIAMLQHQNETSITINDLVLADGEPGGTEVLIKLPVHHD
jgi:tetratricopeptide (TPR) repeat protein